MKLTTGHIIDLTTQRYVERIKNKEDIGDYKVIIDTHAGTKGVEVTPPFTMDNDVSKLIDNLNTKYHNQIASHLGFDISLGDKLSKINRSNW